MFIIYLGNYNKLRLRALFCSLSLLVLRGKEGFIEAKSNYLSLRNIGWKNN